MNETKSSMVRCRRRSMPSFRILLCTLGLGHLLLTDAQGPTITKYGKELRIGMTGVFPNFYFDKNDVIKGSEITALRMLSEKMGFQYSISLGNNFDDLVNKVCFVESFL